MQTISKTACILAAGHGSRLRPHTKTRPKPLVEVAGRSLLDRNLDHLSHAGLREAVLNLHYLGDQIPAHLSTRNDFTFHYSKEEELLDTGGGIKKMLHHFDAPFFVLSGDGLWDGDDALTTMQKSWNSKTMDILILLQPVESMHLTQGIGDYDLDPDGRAIRSPDKTGTHMFTSIRINHKHIFDAAPDGPFSYRDLMDKAQQKGRLFGITHNNDWHHISTPKDLETVDAAYKAQNHAA